METIQSQSYGRKWRWIMLAVFLLGASCLTIFENEGRWAVHGDLDAAGFSALWKWDRKQFYIRKGFSDYNFDFKAYGDKKQIHDFIAASHIDDSPSFQRYANGTVLMLDSRIQPDAKYQDKKFDYIAWPSALPGWYDSNAVENGEAFDFRGLKVHGSVAIDEDRGIIYVYCVSD